MGLCLAVFLSVLASLQPVGAFTLRDPPLPGSREEPEGAGQGAWQVEPPRPSESGERQLPSSPSSHSEAGPRAPGWSEQLQGAASTWAAQHHGETEAARHKTEAARQVSAGARDQQPAVYKFSPGDAVQVVTSLVEVAAAEKADREKKEFQGVDLSSQPQALLQEVHQRDVPQHQGVSMALGLLLGGAALCGLVMAALFQCCCRKKRGQGQGQEQDEVKAGQGSLPRTRTPSPQPQPDTLPLPPDVEEDRESESHRLLDEDLGDFSAVQRETEILKSFRKPPPPKNRGKATRAARQKQEPAPAKDDFFPVLQSVVDTAAPEAGREFQDSSLAAVDVGAKRASMELLLADALGKDKGREEGKGDKEEEVEEEEDSLLTEPPPPARRITPTRETNTPPRGERTPPRREATPKLEEPAASTDRPSSFVEGFANGGNIFMQIDPTVKRSLEKAKNGSKIPVTRRSTASPTDSPVISPLIKPDRRSPDRRSPQTSADSPPLAQAPTPSLRPGSHRKFLVPSVHGEQMDELLKSLKTRLQEDSTVDSSSLSGQSKPQHEDTTDDGEAKGRDRSYSDSSKPKRVVKQTDL